MLCFFFFQQKTAYEIRISDWSSALCSSDLADLNELRGLLYLYEDTVPFLARQVARAARGYLEDLLPPFFSALVRHTGESNYSWHTPGHGGGVAYRKSPVGQAFHQFFGANTLRSDQIGRAHV